MSRTTPCDCSEKPHSLVSASKFSGASMLAGTGTSLLACPDISTPAQAMTTNEESKGAIRYIFLVWFMGI